MTPDVHHPRFGQRIRKHGTGITGKGHPEEQQYTGKTTPKIDRKPPKLGLTRGFTTNSPITNNQWTNDNRGGKYDQRSRRPRY